MRRLTSVLAATTLALLACAPRAGAQSTTGTITWVQQLSGSPTGTDFANGRVVLGYANVVTSNCARTLCRVRIFSSSALAGNLRYVLSSVDPLPSACTNTVPTSQAAAAVVTTFTTATTVKVYVCYQLSWTATPPATLAPAVTIRLTNN